MLINLASIGQAHGLGIQNGDRARRSFDERSAEYHGERNCRPQATGNGGKTSLLFHVEAPAASAR
jgi:hypothetical protein